jgi:hypothetical protein
MDLTILRLRSARPDRSNFQRALRRHKGQVRAVARIPDASQISALHKRRADVAAGCFAVLNVRGNPERALSGELSEQHVKVIRMNVWTCA